MHTMYVSVSMHLCLQANVNGISGKFCPTLVFIHGAYFQLDFIMKEAGWLDYPCIPL